MSTEDMTDGQQLKAAAEEMMAVTKNTAIMIADSWAKANAVLKENYFPLGKYTAKVFVEVMKVLIATSRLAGRKFEGVPAETPDTVTQAFVETIVRELGQLKGVTIFTSPVGTPN